MDYKNNLIIVEGEEYYLRKKKIENIVSSILPQSFSDFNYIKLDGKKINLREILSNWEELPFGNTAKVVHVEDYHRVKIKQKDKATALFLKALDRGLRRNFLILECDSFDRRVSFNKEIERHATVYSYKKVREWEFPRKIKEYAFEKGFSIKDDAVEVLAASFSDLMTLYSELDKLFSYKKDSKVIELNDVKSVVFPSKEYSLFDLQDAILKKDLKSALNIGENLLDNGYSFASICGFLESTFKKAFDIAFGGSTPSSPSFYQKKLLSFADLYTSRGIERALILVYKIMSLSRKTSLPESLFLSYLLTFLIKLAR